MARDKSRHADDRARARQAKMSSSKARLLALFRVTSVQRRNNTRIWPPKINSSLFHPPSKRGPTLSSSFSPFSPPYFSVSSFHFFGILRATFRSSRLLEEEKIRDGDRDMERERERNIYLLTLGYPYVGRIRRRGDISCFTLPPSPRVSLFTVTGFYDIELYIAWFAAGSLFAKYLHSTMHP